VVVRQGYIVAYRRLVTSTGAKPRKEYTPIQIADVVRMTTALQSLSADDSVPRALETPSDTPGPRRQVDISHDPDQRLEAPLEAPSPSSAVPA
jgi:hypothetical protein